MLRTTRLPMSRHAHSPTITTTRSITFATGKTTRPITLVGNSTTTSPLKRRTPTSSFARPPSTWSASTISTLAAGSMFAGSWYVIHTGRKYKAGDEAGKYDEKVVGKVREREGKVNRDWVGYDKWVGGRGK